MSENALGTLLALLLLASIIQGNPGYTYMICQQRWIFSIGFDTDIGFWCDKLLYYNAMFLSACTPADCSLYYQLQSVSDFVS